LATKSDSEPAVPASPATCCPREARRKSISKTLERHQFSGLIHSAGKLLHTSKRISTSMTTVLLSLWINTFYGIYISVYLGTLTLRLVHPKSPVLLTKKDGPLATRIPTTGSTQAPHISYPFKVRESAKIVSTLNPLIIRFT